MERLSGWELRQRAEKRGIPVSGKQFASYQAWGLIPEQAEGGWRDADVERLIRIRELEAHAWSLHRRVILLQDPRWPIPGDKLRQAMIDTIPSIEAPKKKMRALYRALQVRYGHISVEKAATARVPQTWTLPPRPMWERIFHWPTEEEFDQIANSVWADTQSLMQSPLVIRSGLLAGIPIEEIAVLLMTHQLTLTPDMSPHETSETDSSKGSR